MLSFGLDYQQLQPATCQMAPATDLTKNKPRLDWVDYAKGIAIILVVYRHILIGIQRSGIEVSVWLRNANEIVYSFRMPLFFILSGVFIAKSIRKYPGMGFISLKSRTILYPYFVWGIIQISVQIILSSYTNAQRGWIDFTYLVLNPRAIDQLWYLLALFNCSILFYLLYSALNLNRIGIALVSIVLYGCSVFVEDYSLFHDLFYYFIFLVIGHLCYEWFLNETYNRYLKSPWVLLAMLPFFAGTQWYWLHHQDMNVFLFAIIALLGSFFVFSMAFILAERSWLTNFKVIGKHSLQIYLMHLLVVSFVRIVMTKFMHVQEAMPILLTGWVLGIYVPIVVYSILKKTPGIVLFEPRIRPESR
jgi:fucose 4-O-acetylase-like acetyltransferase